MRVPLTLPSPPVGERGYIEPMSKVTAVEESFAEWRNDPEYLAAYDALEEEFHLLRAEIEAQMRPDNPARSVGRGRS